MKVSPLKAEPTETKPKMGDCVPATRCRQRERGASGSGVLQNCGKSLHAILLNGYLLADSHAHR